MSLLLSEGHPAANKYPLAVLWSEARIVRQRLAGRTRLDAVLMQQVIASVLSKSGGKELKKTLKGLDEHD